MTPGYRHRRQRDDEPPGRQAAGMIGADTNFWKIDSSGSTASASTPRLRGHRLTEKHRTPQRQHRHHARAACAAMSPVRRRRIDPRRAERRAGGTTLNVIGNMIDLLALGGSIGAFTNAATGRFTPADLKVDSGRGSGCAATYSLAVVPAIRSRGGHGDVQHRRPGRRRHLPHRARRSARISSLAPRPA